MKPKPNFAPGQMITPGETYNGDGVPAELDTDPDWWICRRERDYRPGQIPILAQRAACTLCGATVIYNPATKLTSDKVCMQCVDIEPLPL